VDAAGVRVTIRFSCSSGMGGGRRTGGAPTPGIRFVVPALQT
jgi:hypothetical protein